MKLSGPLSLLVICCIVSVASSETCWSSGECLSNTIYYDYIQYVSRWPSSYTTQPYPPYVNSFTLHGIWPTFNDNDYPCTCSNEQFSFKDISDLYPQLEVAWFDFDGWNSTQLWSHEWQKHGTCATENGNSKLQTQHDFFSLAIQWHTQMNTLNALSKAGIVPSSSKYYSSSAIYNAIKDYFGVPPLLQCTKLNSQTVLYLVSFCFTNTTLELTECGNCITQQWNDSEGCSNEVYLPPLNWLPLPPHREHDGDLNSHLNHFNNNNDEIVSQERVKFGGEISDWK